MEAGTRSETASFAEGDLSRHLMRLSGYMILGFLAMTLASFVETVYLGRIGTEAIAAVTFAFPILMIIGAATRGIGVGIGAVLARAIGAGDRERAAFLTTHGLLLVLAFNIACSIFLIAFAEPLSTCLALGKPYSTSSSPTSASRRSAIRCSACPWSAPG